MRAGDTVVHSKTGRRGTVKDADWKGTGYARVQFESRQSVVSHKGLRVVTGAAPDERADEIARQRVAVRRASQPPYDLMREAVAHFETEHPEADEVRPGWYGGRVYCEIWKDGHAKVAFY